MRKVIFKLLLFVVVLSICIPAMSQEGTEKREPVEAIIDSLEKSGIILNDNHSKPEIVLSTSQAVTFLQQRYQSHYWKDTSNPLRLAIGQLIFNASNPPYDSTEYLLKKFPFDSLSIPWDKFYIWEPLRVKIPVITPANFQDLRDSTLINQPNDLAGVMDSTGLANINQAGPDFNVKPTTGLKDTTFMVIIDTLHSVSSSYQGFPFKYYSYPYQADSIKVAVNSLLKYLEERDSTIVNFTGIGNLVTPVWLNSKSDKVVRYWLKNEFSDSVTIWIGNPSRDTIGLYLEQGVNFRRPGKQSNYSDAKINVQAIDNSKLLEVQKIIVKPQYWKYRSEASLVFSQSALSNWVKGGENSVSTALDITGYADYTNKSLKLSSNNFIRLKLGFLKSGKQDLRKNLDLLETNSKLNHKAFGKFDFSGILLFKTQVAPGKNFKTEPPEKVSKFLNPAIITVGFGLDYKPSKVTSINLSPLSYKGTFVTDTVLIDQTKYGIAKDKKSLNEPGASFMITNEFNPIKNLTVTNRLQLFTNYIKNPQNIDIDWEMIAVLKLNWFTDVRFNTHLIFDDDTKTVVLDKDDNPILGPDGNPKKTARIQFKEMLGLSLVFRF